MNDESKLHEGPGMRHLLGVLAQGAPAPAAAKRFDQTTSDGLLRLTLDPDGTCTVDIDHMGAESEDGMAHVEAAIKTLYNQATSKPTTPKAPEEESR
ncbi:hypothetical protein [Glycomyces buryatensis]|uniref:Uncharacterized protein n=1 Tax=Glycomyces buryatensis TaxID=2570927 RepID=A0A4S8QGX5_9ACTN|nr:hypothetical protein [Glycomyces buryatensis]THV40639.1 hypothetical protein FAB82_15370 [Glycomyces buryatensis]